MSIADQFSEESEQCERRLRTLAPFIYEEDRVRILCFEVGKVQSRMHLDAPHLLMNGYTQTMTGFLFFIGCPRHIGTIGLGGGSIEKYCYRGLPQTRITVAEINPKVIELRDQFFIPKDDSRFRVLCEDGANFVFRHTNEFDVLLVDGFGPGGQPPQLCSQRFYDNCYDALTSDGMLVANLSEHGFRPLVARLRKSFRDQVLMVRSLVGGKQIAFAGKGNGFAYLASDSNRSDIGRRATPGFVVN